MRRWRYRDHRSAYYCELGRLYFHVIGDNHLQCLETLLYILNSYSYGVTGNAGELAAGVRAVWLSLFPILFILSIDFWPENGKAFRWHEKFVLRTCYDSPIWQCDQSAIHFRYTYMYYHFLLGRFPLLAAREHSAVAFVVSTYSSYMVRDFVYVLLYGDMVYLHNRTLQNTLYKIYMNLLVFILHYLPFVRLSNGTVGLLNRRRRHRHRCRLCNAEKCVYKYISRTQFPIRTGAIWRKW